MDNDKNFGNFISRFFTSYEIEKITPIFYISIKIIIYRFVSHFIPKTNNPSKKTDNIPFDNNLLREGAFEPHLFRSYEEKLNRLIVDSIGIPYSNLKVLNVPSHFNIHIFEGDKDLLHKIGNYFFKLDELCNVISISSITDGCLLGFIYENYILKDEKSKGAYYTPTIITKYICSELLLHKIGLKKCKILDPACGTGIFLVETLRSLMDKNAVPNIQCESEVTKTEISKLSSVLKNIYGMDMDSVAVCITKINLWLKLIAICFAKSKKIDFKGLTGSVFKILDVNIISRDFLFNEKYNHPYFDIILGNPPYISSKQIDSRYKEQLKVKYKTAVKQFDLYTVFIEKSFQILKDKGLFGFIIPDSFLGRSHFEDIRRLILENTIIGKIDQIRGVFKDPNVSNVILFFQKFVGDNEFQFNRYRDFHSFSNKEGESISIPQGYCLLLEKSKILFINQIERVILSKISKISQKLEDFIIVHRGEEYGKKSQLIYKKKTLNSMKLLFGENIRRFSIEFSNNYISINNVMKKQNVSLYNSPKILIRQLGNEINAAFDRYGEFVTLQTVYNVQLNDEGITYEYLLGILNSKLMNFYYKTMIQEKMLFPRILLENIKKIPIIVCEKNIQNKITQLVSKIINLKKVNEETLFLEKELDNLIFKIYGLDSEEKKIILRL